MSRMNIQVLMFKTKFYFRILTNNSRFACGQITSHSYKSLMTQTVFIDTLMLELGFSVIRTLGFCNLSSA